MFFFEWAWPTHDEDANTESTKHPDGKKGLEYVEGSALHIHSQTPENPELAAKVVSVADVNARPL